MELLTILSWDEAAVECPCSKPNWSQGLERLAGVVVVVVVVTWL